MDTVKEKPKKPKTMRSANIRISAKNNTKENGIIEYSYDDIQNIVFDWNKDKEFEYFIIMHNENIDNIHYHIVLSFIAPTRFDTVKSKFPYGNIERSKSLKNSIQYLIHMNSPEKFQYSPEQIITNSKELNKYLIRSKVSEELDINFYVDEISKGNIREYEYTEKIPIDIYTKYSPRIDKAFKYFYDKEFNNADRNIEVEFYYGAGGTGKTVYAKTISMINNESYCVTSSKNDPLQDYKGQDVLIFDDLRDSTFEFDDLLKILDNHTKSSIKSRYVNKKFIGNRIIITSNIELFNWYKQQKKEDIHQLHRRIPIMQKFNEDKTIDLYVYSNKKKKYEFQYQYDNPIIFDDNTEEEDILVKNKIKRFKF